MSNMKSKCLVRRVNVVYEEEISYVKSKCLI